MKNNSFDPNDPLIQQCVKAIILEEKGNPEEAAGIFLQTWKEATTDFEKFLTAWFLARHQKSTSEILEWLETSANFALKSKDQGAFSALPTLYEAIAQCCEKLDDPEKAKENRELSVRFQDEFSDNGPFFHGTRADLQNGDLLTSGGSSNYQPELRMNHIYFTALAHGAGLAAALAKGDGKERVYIVEPTGSFESDPNVTDKKFPGNLTRSYRSESPLKITGEVTDWTKQTSEDVQKWKEKLADNDGEIIN